MARVEVRFAGFGGQGVVLAGVLLGRAATIYDGRFAIQTQSYGAAARGGAARSDVILDDMPIIYPQLVAPDIMVAFTTEALNKYKDEMKASATLIIDRDLVTVSGDSDFDIHSVPATAIASDEFGRSIVANMVMLGYLTGLGNTVSREAVEAAIREGVPKGSEEMNLAVFGRGFSLAKDSVNR